MPERRAAISTPFWDGLLTGGLSIAAIAPILTVVLLFDGSAGFVDTDWLSLAILVNGTHFMASYRLLYVSREQILGNRWSALFVPLALLAILAYAFFGPHRAQVAALLLLASSVYLAWHYTGQAWGMVSTFSHLAGVRYTSRERLAIRSGPRMLLTLHVLFALSGRFPPAELIDPQTYIDAYSALFRLVVAGTALSLGAGAWAYVSARSRGESVPIRAVVPWLALFLWYPFWYFVPGGFVWVQLSHALQYLAFPMRVELNRYSHDRPRTSRQKTRHGLVLYLILAAAAAFFLHGPPIAAHAFGNGWYSTPDARLLFGCFTSCIAIHHYFIDGAVWKLSNPKVRGELFSHLG